MDERKQVRWVGAGAATALAVVALLAILGYAWWSADQGGGDPATWSPDTRRKIEALHFRVENDLIRWNKIPEARAVLEKHLARYDMDSYGHVLMAKVQMAEQKGHEAYRSLVRSLELDEADHAVHFLAGGVASQLGKLGKARYHHTRACELNPGESEYALYLGQSLFKMDDLKMAKLQLLRALQIDSSQAAAHAILAEIFVQEGKPSMALGQANKALEQLGRDDPRYLEYILLKGQLLRRLNRPDESLAVLMGLSPARQQDPRAVEHLALSYLMMSQPTKAAARWVELFVLDPQNVRAAAEAGDCFRRAGEVRHARRYLDFARRLDPEHPRVKALAEALVSLGAG